MEQIDIVPKGHSQLFSHPHAEKIATHRMVVAVVASKDLCTLPSNLVLDQ